MMTMITLETMEAVVTLGPTELTILGLVLVIHFIPTFIALWRRHPKTGGILLLNLFLSWSILGWFGALVWSLWPANES